MALSGMTVTAIAGQLRVPGRRVWYMLRRAVRETRGSADCSGATRVGTDDTARRRGQDYISTMAGLDGRRVVAVTGGRDRGTVARLCDQLDAHGGDRARVAEALCLIASELRGWGWYRFSVPCYQAARPKLCLCCRGLVEPSERLVPVLS
jgi:hypothetical protein